MTTKGPFRRLAALLIAGLLAAAPIQAQEAPTDPAQAMVAELRLQGYVDFEVSRTLLGRIRVLAHRPEGVREIVFNPATGEILRDYWSPSLVAAPRAGPQIIDRGDDGAAPAPGRPSPRGPAEGGEDHDRGHGNDADGQDGDNPGRGQGRGNRH